MRNQLWIIILLIVWTGQWEPGIVERWANLMVTGRAVQSQVEGLNSEDRVPILTRLGGNRRERRAWSSGEDFRRLVRYQVQCRLPWLFACANSRSRIHSRGQRDGGKKSDRGVEKTDSEEHKRSGQGVGESQSESILEAQGWGLSPEKKVGKRMYVLSSAQA